MAWFSILIRSESCADYGVVCRFVVAAQQTFNAVTFGDYRLVTHFDKWVNEGWLCFPVRDDLMKFVESIQYLICSNNGICGQRRRSWMLRIAAFKFAF